MTIGDHPVRQAGPTPTSAKQVSPTSWSISGNPEARSNHQLCECSSLWLLFSLSSLFISLVISPILSLCLPLILYFSNTIDLSLSYPNYICLCFQFCLPFSSILSLTFPNSLSLSQLFFSLFLSLYFYRQLCIFRFPTLSLSFQILFLLPCLFFLSITLSCSLSSSLSFCPLVVGKARKNSTLKTSPGTPPGTVSSAAPVLPNSVATNPRNALRFVLSQSCKCHDPPTCPPYLPCSRPALVTRLYHSLARLQT